MFLTHLPENPKAKERYAKIQAQLDGYALPGTQVELCFPDDYPGAKLSLSLGARNEVPGIYHVLQTPAIIRKIVWAEKHGYDAVVQSNTFDPGVEAARQAVRIPVIAAGGIADAKGVAAVMALGAAGVQVGTAYLLCAEATTSAVHRAALTSDAARVTAVTNVFTGRPARGIVNRIVREVGPISAAAPPFPLAVSAMAPLRAKAESLGSGDFSPLWAGQNTSGCKEISAATLTRELAAGVAPSRT